MPAVTVAAQINARPEHLAFVKSELLKLVVPTRQEAGCIEYRLHQDLDDPALFLFFETWEDRASLEQHLASGHFKRYAEAVTPCIVDKTVRIMTSIA